MQDGELYELVGLGWRFPIWVNWINPTLAEVTIPDIPTLKAQRKIVEEALRTHCSHRESNTWFFAKKAILGTAIKSAFTDPEDVVIWKHETQNWPDDADFVNAYCKHRDAVVRDPRNFAAMWDSICKFMIHWTMFEERSVDFGFARLDAFCVRANWKNAILGRVMAMRRQTNGPRTAESIRRTTRKLLHQSFISGIDISTMKCRWTLELTPKRTFYEAADLREAKRKLITRGSYLYNVLRQLHSPEHKNRLYECLLEYTRQTKLPYAALPHGFEPRCDSSGKESPINFATPKKWASTPVVAGSKMEDKTGRAVVPEDALLPTMQDLQSLPEDVRHARECVDATGGDEITTLGLLLLHSVEGPAPSELLDDGATGWDGKLGVAPETKQLPNSEESGNAT